MHIGIYNRWLHTLGGGERETAMFARVLSADHTVELLTHQPCDLALLADRLNLDVSNLPLRLLPLDPNFEHVAAASAGYDLFLNISHSEMFIPRAPRNILRVFFPGEAEPGEDQASPIPTELRLTHGFYRPETGAVRPFAWTGARAEAQVPVPHSARAKQLQIVLHGWRPPDAAPTHVRLLVDGTLIGERQLRRDGTWDDWRIDLPASATQSPVLTVTLETTTFNPAALGTSDDRRDLGCAVAALRVIEGGWTLRRRAPERGGELNLAAYDLMIRHRIGQTAATYGCLLANSSFTRDWIARRWELASTLLYPPVDTESLVPAVKQPIILSVGRFFPGSHNKKHLPMITAFRALCDAGLSGWDYHLVGGCDLAVPEHRAYLQELRDAAANYPVTLHVNAPFAELRALYGKAALFWHATGFEEDEAREPERFEHFGISTVEAMAAGCVPVVIEQAGQREIVQDGVNGLFWRTLPDLQARTHALIGDPRLRERMAVAARQRSEDFGAERFARELRAIVARFTA